MHVMVLTSMVGRLTTILCMVKSIIKVVGLIIAVHVFF